MLTFENQLFISYAHIDNDHFSGTSQGWIDLLHERLEIRLAQLLGKTPKIGIATPPGIHVIVFEHPVYGRLTTSVECKAGEAKAVTVRLGRSPDTPVGGAKVDATRHR